MRDRMFVENELDLVKRRMTQLIIQQADVDTELKELDRKEMQLQRELRNLNAPKR